MVNLVIVVVILEEKLWNSSEDSYDLEKFCLRDWVLSKTLAIPPDFLGNYLLSKIMLLFIYFDHRSSDAFVVLSVCCKANFDSSSPTNLFIFLSVELLTYRFAFFCLTSLSYDYLAFRV